MCHETGESSRQPGDSFKSYEIGSENPIIDPQISIIVSRTSGTPTHKETTSYTNPYGGDKGAPPTPALHRIPPTPSLPPPITEEDRSGRCEVGAHLSFVEDEESQADGRLPSAGSRDPQPHAVAEADDIPSMAELFGPDDEDTAPAVAAPVHRHQLPGALILYELARDPDSMLGEVGAACGLQVVRLCSRDIDLSDGKAADQLLDQVQATPGASTHCSIECAPWSSGQHMNIATRGPAYQKELDAKRAQSRHMLMAFIRVAAMIYHMGGEVSFEGPRYVSGWSLPELIALIKQFALIDGLCDGCVFGLVSKDNLPLFKPWRIVPVAKGSPPTCRHTAASKLVDFAMFLSKVPSLGDPPFLSRADGWGDHSVSVSVCSGLCCSSFAMPSVDASTSSRE